MATVEVNIPEPVEPEYTLTLNREEAQVLLDILGPIGTKEYEALRVNGLRRKEDWEHLVFVDGAAVPVHNVWSALHKAKGLKRYDGSINR